MNEEGEQEERIELTFTFFFLLSLLFSLHRVTKVTIIIIPILNKCDSQKKEIFDHLIFQLEKNNHIRINYQSYFLQYLNKIFVLEERARNEVECFLSINENDVISFCLN